jgi:deoxyribose-phosphate aldolase
MITPGEAHQLATGGSLSRLIDQTLLEQDADRNQVEQFIHSSIPGDFFSLCMHPCWLPVVTPLLHGTKTIACTVTGFPLGSMSTSVKIAETADALERGAGEIDMVINIGMLKSGETEYIAKEISSLKKLCGKRVLKVIIETALLSDKEKILAASICVDAGADFIKTSTGFAGGGATLSDITLLRNVIPETVGLKASGGIRTRDEALSMIEAGATRIGTSRGLEFL